MWANLFELPLLDYVPILTNISNNLFFGNLVKDNIIVKTDLMHLIGFGHRFLVLTSSSIGCRFIECCSLSELLSQLTTEVKSNSSTPSNELGPLLMGSGDLSQLDLPEQKPAETITITVTKDGHSFDKHGMSLMQQLSTRTQPVKYNINAMLGITSEDSWVSLQVG